MPVLVMILCHMVDNKNMRDDSHRKPRLQKIGVFTSGGDAPGMNAAIRAVTRAQLLIN